MSSYWKLTTYTNPTNDSIGHLLIYFKATNPNEVKAKIGIRKTRPLQIHMRRGEMYKKYELIHARLNAQKIK